MTDIKNIIALSKKATANLQDYKNTCMQLNEVMIDLWDTRNDVEIELGVLKNAQKCLMAIGGDKDAAYMQRLTRAIALDEAFIASADRVLERDPLPPS